MRSSPPPRIDDIDIPPAGRNAEKEARSRSPLKGDAVGGPRGAGPDSDDALEGRWGGEGGGIWREWKGGGGGSGSWSPFDVSAIVFEMMDVRCRPWGGCGGLPAEPPPTDPLREGS